MVDVDIVAELALSALCLIVAAEAVGVDRGASSATGSIGSVILEFTGEACGSS